MALRIGHILAAQRWALFWFLSGIKPIKKHFISDIDGIEIVKKQELCYSLLTSRLLSGHN
jgi:hypothetical protein